MASTKRSYSPAELKLIKILKTNKGSPISSKTLTNIFYGSGHAPINSSRSIVTMINNIIVKNRNTREGFKVRKSDRNGPHPAEYWIE